MKAHLNNGEVVEINTKYVFNNQYSTMDGCRINDTDIKYIEDDIRLKDFYWSSVGCGTYDEVLKLISNERNKINQCEKCFWNRRHPISSETISHTEIKDGKEIVTTTTVYEMYCQHRESYGGKCCYDIEKSPILFREKFDCFFCKYPNGVPDQKDFMEFLISHSKKYDIVPYYNRDELSVENSFKCSKFFGSYKFSSRWYDKFFTLENNRNRYKFFIDFENKKFISINYSSYNVTDVLCDNYTDNPISNFNKFAKWLWEAVDDYNNSKKKRFKMVEENGK